MSLKKIIKTKIKIEEIGCLAFVIFKKGMEENVSQTGRKILQRVSMYSN